MADYIGPSAGSAENERIRGNIFLGSIAGFVVCLGLGTGLVYFWWRGDD